MIWLGIAVLLAMAVLGAPLVAVIMGAGCWLTAPTLI